ncbi:CAP domain-containing protein [Ruixingdingia sedimenti]|uniref:CAP domain-containing protein n=1 Tax=Ruixingdingia sedimenti TaxID=3073604 RepID=A0ABU1F6X3_9RHOB|nr:CAP domain-containing protein [Xinfangfangia sp. LG-4]MDR5652625.1 CAP domain-containing protein [Xinfangfangia sp. LG-4]
MRRSLAIALCGALALTACAAPAVQLGSDGKPLPQLYKLSPAETGKIQLRVLDSVNALRRARAAGPLQLNAELNAAAATHSRDMSVQNRPWHFGSDGSSPLDRVRRAGYPGMMLGELISETYETELETLAAWTKDPDTRTILLQPEARDLGFAYYQEPNGKIWWTLLTGG